MSVNDPKRSFCPMLQTSDSDMAESAAGELAVAAREMRRVRRAHRVPLFRGRVSNGRGVCRDLVAVHSGGAAGGDFPVGDAGAAGGHHLHRCRAPDHPVGLDLGGRGDRPGGVRGVAAPAGAGRRGGRHLANGPVPRWHRLGGGVWRPVVGRGTRQAGVWQEGHELCPARGLAPQGTGGRAGSDVFCDRWRGHRLVGLVFAQVRQIVR